MTPQEAQMVVALLQAGYPAKPLPDSTVALYTRELEDFDFDAAQEAVRLLVRSSKWLPSLSEILEETATIQESRAWEARAKDRALPAPKQLTEEEKAQYDEERKKAAEWAFAELRKRGLMPVKSIEDTA